MCVCVVSIHTSFYAFVSTIGRPFRNVPVHIFPVHTTACPFIHLSVCHMLIYLCPPLYAFTFFIVHNLYLRVSCLSYLSVHLCLLHSYISTFYYISSSSFFHQSVFLSFGNMDVYSFVSLSIQMIVCPFASPLVLACVRLPIVSTVGIYPA